MKKLLIVVLITIVATAGYFKYEKEKVYNEEVEEVNYEYTLEELTGVSKWVILEGSLSMAYEKEKTGNVFTNRQLYLNTKYHFGYSIDTKDVLITQNGIEADKANIYLDYIETEDTDIFNKENWFAKKHTHSQIEDIKKEMKNRVRIQLYDQSYYEKAYEHLIEEVENYINIKGEF